MLTKLGEQNEHKNIVIKLAIANEFSHAINFDGSFWKEIFMTGRPDHCCPDSDDQNMSTRIPDDLLNQGEKCFNSSGQFSP
ncbi:hypothetical protein T4B_5693 [Trichinella pseudospiralis]|uniref:Uncharacterized protein n=1 Tax=Trichinella pseudospiralis TaxID=6337 RepID=A0A0V1J2K1_TRIPS|nr:hypothetical protein T4B_5693 [Trichinella pseudospiralis]